MIDLHISISLLLNHCNSGGRLNGTLSGKGQIWLDNVACNGNEESLIYCGNRGWGVEDCGHYEDVAIICGKHYFIQ